VYVSVVDEVERIHRNRIASITTNVRRNAEVLTPPKGCAGLYFLYTSYVLEVLIAAGDPPTPKAVPISEIARRYGRLKFIRPPEADGL